MSLKAAREDLEAEEGRRRDIVNRPLANVIAGSFALAAFAVAIMAGLASGNHTLAVLTRGVIAMVLCYPLGLMAGLICVRAIEAGILDRSESSGASHHPTLQPPRSAGDARSADGEIVTV